MGKQSSTQMSKRTALAKQVDPALSKNEQETGISFFGDSHRFELTTYHPTLVRKTLLHDHADIEWVYVRREGGRNERVSQVSDLDLAQSPDAVEGVKATMPIGTFTLKGTRRSNDKISKIMSTPDDIEGVRNEFANE